ncbi:MAG: hypothetical protein U0527_05990 [Candidatus Eisenbacteria bacterium]
MHARILHQARDLVFDFIERRLAPSTLTFFFQGDLKVLDHLDARDRIATEHQFEVA